MPRVEKEPETMSSQGERPDSKDGLERAFVQRLGVVERWWDGGGESMRGRVEAGSDVAGRARAERRVHRRMVVAMVDGVVWCGVVVVVVVVEKRCC